MKTKILNIAVSAAATLVFVMSLAGCSAVSAGEVVGPVAIVGEAVAVIEGGSIQDAIDKAGNVSEIVLEPGTYMIAKPLRIEGKENITLKSSGDVRILGEYIDKQIIIIKDCKNVTLENIRACHKSNEGAAEMTVFEKRSGSVVDVEDCEKAVFINCELEGCGVYGIYAVNTPKIDITGCYIHHNSWKAFGFFGHSGVMNVTVRDSTITNNADFIEKEGTVNVGLEGANVVKFNNKEGYNTR